MSTLDQQICLPNGLCFDRQGNPRQRYIRLEYNKAHCVMTPSEADSIADGLGAAIDNAMKGPV